MTLPWVYHIILYYLVSNPYRDNLMLGKTSVHFWLLPVTQKPLSKFSNLYDGKYFLQKKEK